MEGNLLFIKGTSNLEEMLHPEFLKDLYNIVVENAKFNLDILVTNFGKKLIQSYQQKEIYAYAKFNIIPKEVLQMEDERKKLLSEFESKILLRGSVKTEAPNTSLYTNSPKN
jgi:hypothetical protein